jgi:plastocyanin
LSGFYQTTTLLPFKLGIRSTEQRRQLSISVKIQLSTLFVSDGREVKSFLKIKSTINIGILLLTLTLVFAGCGRGNTTTSQPRTATPLPPSTQSTTPVVPVGTTTAPPSGIKTTLTSSTTSAANETASIATPTKSTPVVTGSANIEVTGGGFSPGKITIAVGTTIRWVVPQHEKLVVESETEGIDGFAISFGDVVETTFTAPGIYKFHLEEGPYVTCTVTVVTQ